MFFFTLEGVLAKGACTPVEAQGKNHLYEMRFLDDFYYYGRIFITAGLLFTHIHLQS